MGMFLQLKCHLHEESYFSVIVIHVQLFSVVFGILGIRNNLKKKTGRLACCLLLVTFCSLLVTFCFLLFARSSLLSACYFLLVGRYFLLVAQQEILKNFCLVKVNKRFSILICTKSLIC